jgi:hypothetical protein
MHCYCIIGKHGSGKSMFLLDTLLYRGLDKLWNDDIHVIDGVSVLDERIDYYIERSIELHRRVLVMVFDFNIDSIKMLTYFNHYYESWKTEYPNNVQFKILNISE